LCNCHNQHSRASSVLVLLNQVPIAVVCNGRKQLSCKAGIACDVKRGFRFRAAGEGG
jgi:hypothetical protein